MKTLNIFWIFAALISSAFASGDKGNGGDAVVCFLETKFRETVEQRIKYNKENPDLAKDPFRGGLINTVTTVDLLDMYQLRKDVQKSEVKSDGPYKEIIKEKLDLLAQKTSFANIIEEVKKDMLFSEASFGVMELNDSKHVIYFEENCLLVQLAHQKKIGSLSKVYYEKRLFDKLSENDKAALYFHEWIYSYAVSSKGHTDSLATRELVAYIFSNLMIEEDGKEFNSFLGQLNLGNYNLSSNQKIDVFGTEVNTMGSFIILPSGKKFIEVKSPLGVLKIYGRIYVSGQTYGFNLYETVKVKGLEASSIKFSISNKEVKIHEISTLNDFSTDGLEFKGPLYITFYNGGKAYRINHTGTENITWFENDFVEAKTFNSQSTGIILTRDEKQNVTEISYTGAQIIFHKVYNQRCKSDRNTMTAWPSGNLKKCILNHYETPEGFSVSSVIVDVDSNIVGGTLKQEETIDGKICKAGDYVVYPDGKLKSCSPKRDSFKIFDKVFRVKTVEYYPSGQAKYVKPVNDWIYFEYDKFEVTQKDLSFYENGQLRSIILRNTHRVKLSYKIGKRVKTVKARIKETLDFYPNGKFKKARLANQIILDGSFYSSETDVNFDKNGFIILE